MSRAKKILLGLLIAFLALMGIGYAALPSILPHAIVFAPGSTIHIDARDDPTPQSLRSMGVTRHARVPVGPPAASISMFIIEPSRREPRGTMIILHGIWASKEAELEKGHAWADSGYRVALVDLRGHGRSSGDFLTYGVVESDDLVKVITAMEQEGALKRPLCLIGYSYGGAVALQTAARDRRVDAVASVSTFATMRQVVGRYVVAKLPLIGSLLTEEQVDSATAEAGRLAGFDPARANTVEAVRRITVPIFLAHGTDDRNIPVDHVRQLAHAGGRHVTLVIVDDAGHEDMMFDDHTRLGKELREWVARNVP